LEEDLEKMGCLGLIERPWSLKSDAMIHELVSGAPNQFERTMRGKPDTWSASVWAAVYGFVEAGVGKAHWTNKYVLGKFQISQHKKEGFAINECIDPRRRRILDFLIPISG